MYLLIDAQHIGTECLLTVQKCPFFDFTLKHHFVMGMQIKAMGDYVFKRFLGFCTSLFCPHVLAEM